MERQKQTDRQIETERDRETETERGRETERQRDRQTDRQTDRYRQLSFEIRKKKTNIVIANTARNVQKEM